MMDWMGSVVQILLGLIGLSFLVFIHELGHFWMAKRYGVRIKVFSLGFGKKLISVRRGETEYCISAIPFGGYVAMAGENPDDPDGDIGSFCRQPVRVRALIAFGGPAVNIVFAFMTLYVLYMVGVQEPIEDRLVVGYVERDSPGERAGILPGDTITHIAGKPARGWDRLREEVGISLGAPVAIALRRPGSGEMTTQVVPRELKDLGIGWIGVHPRHRVVVAAQPEESSPAGRGGLKAGDTIMAVCGHYVASYQDVAQAVNASHGDTTEFAVLRGTDTLLFKLLPRYHEEEQRYMVGVQLGLVAWNEMQWVRRGPLDAAIKAAQTSLHLATSIFRYLARMARGQVKAKALSGPPGIVAIIGMSWMESFYSLMMMLALISINLGVVNLLPLAITDGGILMFLGIEALRGRPLSPRVQGVIQQVATAFFIALFIYLTFQDLFRFRMFLR